MQLGPKAMNAMQKEILEKDLKATRKLRKCRLLRTPYIDTVHLGLSQQEILEKRKRIYYVSKDALERMLLLLLLLSRFSRVRVCVTQQTAAHQATPSLGFSRQEHWSGLPFPSPMCESEVAQSCLTLRDPMEGYCPVLNRSPTPTPLWRSFLPFCLPIILPRARD